MLDMSLFTGRDDAAKDIIKRHNESLDHVALKHSVFITGPGRAGKDTLALTLSYVMGLRYGGSTSLAVLPLLHELVCKLGGVSVDRVSFYNDRHLNRQFWFDACNYIREYDITLLPRLALQNSDMLVGIRSYREMKEVIPHAAHCFWVSADVDNDPTLEYSWSDACRFNSLQYLFNDKKSDHYLQEAIKYMKLHGYKFFPTNPKNLTLKINGIFIT